MKKLLLIIACACTLSIAQADVKNTVHLEEGEQVGYMHQTRSPDDKKVALDRKLALKTVEHFARESNAQIVSFSPEYGMLDGTNAMIGAYFTYIKKPTGDNKNLPKKNL